MSFCMQLLFKKTLKSGTKAALTATALPFRGQRIAGMLIIRGDLTHFGLPLRW